VLAGPRLQYGCIRSVYEGIKTAAGDGNGKVCPLKSACGILTDKKR